ncbi:DNA adenine methylase [Bariatricus massiliensis]|uniref:site-specific DNA-methyltransferase (adenine-specific) n=1 Tax=Bariatricus massiliensis TaxID=1745713 RepID=A0ABS8DIG0_9FIRM|nr:DNA adenine methylase [Bariatricus massiliensis]MCB7304843.1 DNA adenine methylase [Bariatricus massiliensis]MCB7375397.1 DNA adenine methylase [Bariatricus massiliensis]MCB7387857.1 DNA adenine methylase [Bariatricus massiliensis]MCB7412054.1 DNA adenine methylase [Bariatricus massiliensis]MCQ5254566.1 DNA adenine methylase [Bariatricus massiliensis]
MNSFISWIGGKKLLKKKIIEQFPEHFDRYIEVFGGAGWVLFDREKHANMEVYNDINGDLVNLFRCVKYHPEALQKELEWSFVSREQFFDYISQNDIRGMTDIQRAARFYCRIKLSFGADLRSFGVRSRDMQKTISYLQEVSERLNRVVIENADFERLLKTYDRESALFYLDPPYYEAEKYYPDRFQPEDHTRLRDALSRITGKFVLSYNDCPEVRELYTGYHIVEVERLDNLATKTNPRRYRELIIKNY